MQNCGNPGCENICGRNWPTWFHLSTPSYASQCINEDPHVYSPSSISFCSFYCLENGVKSFKEWINSIDVPPIDVPRET